MERQIPKKNYIILIIILLLTVFITYYLFLWYKTYQNDKLSKPIINEYINQINLNELETFIIENPNILIYTSVLKNKNIRDFEERFKTILKENDLKNKLVYLDITDENKNEIKDKYQINNISIINTPNILTFKNGNLEDIYQINILDYELEDIKNYLKQNKLIEDNND